MRDFFVVLLDWFYIAKKWVLIQMYSDLKKQALIEKYEFKFRKSSNLENMSCKLKKI